MFSTVQVLSYLHLDPSWNKFEILNMFKRIPVRVTLAGTNTDGTPLNVDMDYFLFETYSSTWDDFLVSNPIINWFH